MESNGRASDETLNELLEKAAAERDRDKFLELLRRINQLLAERRSSPKKSDESPPRTGAA